MESIDKLNNLLYGLWFSSTVGMMLHLVMFLVIFMGIVLPASDDQNKKHKPMLNIMLFVASCWLLFRIYVGSPEDLNGIGYWHFGLIVLASLLFSFMFYKLVSFLNTKFDLREKIVSEGDGNANAEK